MERVWVHKKNRSFLRRGEACLAATWSDGDGDAWITVHGTRHASQEEAMTSCEQHANSVEGLPAAVNAATGA